MPICTSLSNISDQDLRALKDLDGIHRKYVVFSRSTKVRKGASRHKANLLTGELLIGNKQRWILTICLRISYSLVVPTQDLLALRKRFTGRVTIARSLWLIENDSTTKGQTSVQEGILSNSLEASSSLETNNTLEQATRVKQVMSVESILDQSGTDKLFELVATRSRQKTLTASVTEASILPIKT